MLVVGSGEGGGGGGGGSLRRGGAVCHWIFIHSVAVDLDWLNSRINYNGHSFEKGDVFDFLSSC